LSLILIGNTLDEIVNPRLRTNHLFDPRRMVAPMLAVRPVAEDEAVAGVR
jgi:hypothetical protein